MTPRSTWALLVIGVLAACTPTRRALPPASRSESVVRSSATTTTPPSVADGCCQRSRHDRPSDAELLGLPDAVPRIEPRATLGNPAFYEVYGQRYKVLDSAHGFVERGVASWYGPDFHGIATSTGEPYDMYAMTAAHKTLPLPAYAKVTNLRNGRSIVVRINDRGPFKANRIVDLSYAAALKLDIVRDGTAMVELQAVDPDGSVAEDHTTVGADLYAQVGAFSVLENAQRLRDRLSAAGVSTATVRSESTAGRLLHRVRVGPVHSVDDYDALVDQLHRSGIDKVVLAPN